MKIRVQQFPGLEKFVSNEDVIKYTVTLAKQNKRSFKKYFPVNSVYFDDDNDYSKPHKLEEDPNFQTFVELFMNTKASMMQKQQKKRQSEINKKTHFNKFRLNGDRRSTELDPNLMFGSNFGQEIPEQQSSDDSSDTD